MAKRMLLMLGVVVIVIAGLGYYKTLQIQAAVKAHSFQPPPEAITTIVAEKATWPATMIIGTIFTLFVVPSIYVLVARNHAAVVTLESDEESEVRDLAEAAS